MLSLDFHCKENDRMTGTVQKQLRVEVSQDMLDSTNSDPDFMNTITTCVLGVRVRRGEH